MDTLFARILDNAIITAGLLFAAGAGLASLQLAEPAVVAFLLCGMLLMLKAGMAPAAQAEAPPQGVPAGAHG